MVIRHAVWGLLLFITLLGFSAGCGSAQHEFSRQSSEGTKGLLVYVTSNASQVREKALSYGLDVRTIEGGSSASQLVQALLNSPTDKFFAVINPLQRRYIAGGAVSDKVDTVEIDNLFRRLKQVNKAGIQQLHRLYPKEEGRARLVVFSDFECPYCKMMEPMLKSWQERYGDKLEVEFIHFPLPNHEQAFAAAEAAECARAQKQFEPYREKLFESQDSLSEYTFNRIASDLDLNYRAFSRCTSLHLERKKVRQDQYFGQYMGLSGTPTLVLNGEVLFGVSPDEIEAGIDAIVGVSSPKSAEKSSEKKGVSTPHS